MALSRQKKQGAVVGVAAGALALGGVALSTLSATPVDARLVAAQAAAPHAATTSTPAITITAKADNTNPTDDTVFTVSGNVTGAQQGAKIQLQQQIAPTAQNPNPDWVTLPYTTFTDKDNNFSFLVKLEQAGTFNLRILHPADREGPTQATSDPFQVTVTATTTPSTTTVFSTTTLTTSNGTVVPVQPTGTKPGSSTTTTTPTKTSTSTTTPTSTTKTLPTSTVTKTSLPTSTLTTVTLPKPTETVTVTVTVTKSITSTITKIGPPTKP